MPKNPGRASQGGDVEGMEEIDQDGALPGQSLDVARASFDPGYSLDETLQAGYVSKADMKRGFCSYGQGVGESKKTWKETR